MSHFTVTVCLNAKDVEAKGLNDAIAEKLAPYDENESVQPYRDYEDGSPGEYWWVKSVAKGAAAHHADAPVEIRRGTFDGDRGIWSHTAGRCITEAEFVAESRAERADDAVWAEKLGENPGWRDVVLHYNAKWYPKNQVAVPGEESDDDDGLWYDPETDRAYKMSTYNPESKWDWWVVGGRWQRHFISVPGADVANLVFGESGAFGDNGQDRYTDAGGVRCDGGPIELLDFAAMRDAAAVEALTQYDRWLGLVEQHGPVVETWDRLSSLAKVEEITWDEARSRYNSQPIIEAARKAELTGFMGDPVEEVFGTTREEFERIARLSEVPGYALLTVEGEWTAPGRMGWFGVSSDGAGDRDAYKTAASKYLDALPPTTVVVQIDCHI